MELGEARKHGRVQSRGNVKGAFKILAKLNKRREKLEVVRTSMSQFAQPLEAGVSVFIETEKQATAVGRLREFVSTSSLCALVLDKNKAVLSGMVADGARDAGFTHLNLRFGGDRDKVSAKDEGLLAARSRHAENSNTFRRVRFWSES